MAAPPLSFYLLPSLPLILLYLLFPSLPVFIPTFLSPHPPNFPLPTSCLLLTLSSLLWILPFYIPAAADELPSPPPGLIPLSLHEFITLSPQGFVLPNQELKCCVFTQTMPAPHSGLFVGVPRECATGHDVLSRCGNGDQTQPPATGGSAPHHTPSHTSKLAAAAAAGGGRAETY